MAAAPAGTGAGTVEGARSRAAAAADSRPAATAAARRLQAGAAAVMPGRAEAGRPSWRREVAHIAELALAPVKISQ